MLLPQFTILYVSVFLHLVEHILITPMKIPDGTMLSYYNTYICNVTFNKQYNNILLTAHLFWYVIASKLQYIFIFLPNLQKLGNVWAKSVKEFSTALSQLCYKKLTTYPHLNMSIFILIWKINIYKTLLYNQYIQDWRKKCSNVSTNTFVYIVLKIPKYLCNKALHLKLDVYSL